MRFPILRLQALLRGFGLVVALLALGLLPLRADAITPAQDGALLNAQAEVFVDATERLDIEAAEHAAFEPLAGRTALGLIDHPVWLRLQLRGDTDATQTWWLDLSPFSMADVQVFSQRPDAPGWQRLHTGEEQPFVTRPMPWRQFLVPVDLSGTRPTTVYLRLRGYNTLVVPMRLWRLQSWAPHALVDYFVVGACLGVMAGLALYNLLLAARLRQRIFVLYALLVTSYALFSADLLGLGSQYLWCDAFVALPGRNQALVCLYGCFGALFPLYLLDAERVTRWFGRVLHAVAAVYAVSSVAALLGAYALAGVVIQLLPVVWFPLVLGVAIRRGLQRFRPAWYYLAGYGPVFVTLTMLILIGQSKVAATPLTMNAFLVAGALEAVLFSQALAERFNILRREREVALELAVSAKQSQLRAAQDHHAELEDKVAQRTQELEASQQALHKLAYHDPLTELPNRLLFRDRLERLIAASKRDDASTFAVVIIDLDGFKLVNDTHGHHAGDHLLRVVAQRLRGCVREMDTVSRLGGDEFGIILPGLDAAHVREGPLLARLKAACAAPVRYEHALLQVGGSLGVAGFGGELRDRESIYRAADRDMYRAKSATRHRVAP